MRKRIAHGLMTVLCVVSLGAAQGPNSSGSKDTQAAIPRQISEGFKPESQIQTKHHAPYQVGTASWYGEDFDGRATASGEPYNMYDFTAAHPSLPLGTWVRVTNLHNGRKVFGQVYLQNRVFGYRDFEQFQHLFDNSGNSDRLGHGALFACIDHQLAHNLGSPKRRFANALQLLRGIQAAR